jgi:hypothetical protein
MPFLLFDFFIFFSLSEILDSISQISLNWNSLNFAVTGVLALVIALQLG